MFLKRYEKLETIVVEHNNGVSPPQPIPPPSSLSRSQVNWENVQRKWIGQMPRPECYDENIMARLTENVGDKLNETKHDSSLDTTIVTSTPNDPSSRSLLPPPRVSYIRTPLATNRSLQNISANILQNKSKSLGKRNNSISVAKKQPFFQSADKPREFLMSKIDYFKHYQAMHSDSPHVSPPTPNIMRNMDKQKTMHIKREKCTLEAINGKTFGLVGYPDSDDSRNYDNDVHSAGYESSELLESSEDERDDEEEEESQIEQPCDDGHFSQDYDSSRNLISPVDRNDSDNDYDKSEQQHESLRPITSNANLANIESDDDEPIVIRQKKTKHNASLKRRISDQILANDKIIVPSLAENSFQRRCRRSKRLRVKPLNFWCGERPIYKAEQINGSSVLSLVGATAAQMEPLRRKLAQRKKRKTCRLTEDTRPIVEPVAPSTIEQKMDNILDLSIQVKKYKNLSKNMAATVAEHITPYGSIQFNESENSPGLYTSITKKAGDIAMGKIKFDPEVTKTTTKTGDYVTYFNVVYGTLLLKVESKPDLLVKTGSLFEIGPNTCYSIINTRSDQAMIDFTIVRAKT